MANSKASILEKATVAGVAFGCSCAAFAVAVLWLVPALGMLTDDAYWPQFIGQAAILLSLFGLPVIAAIGGIEMGAKLIGAPSKSGCSA